MVKLSMIPFIPWSVYLVADKKGFWEKEGVCIEVTVYPDEPGYVEDMTKQKSDLFPLPLSSILELFKQNNPFYCTGFFDQANGHKKIVVKQKYAGDLKHTSIVLYADEVSTRYFLSRFLATKGLSLHDVELIFSSSTSLPERYSDPEVSACLVFGDDLTPLLELTDSQIAYTTADYTEPFTLAVPARKFTTELKKQFPGIVKGRMLAVDWINQPENKEEFCSLVHQFMFNGSVKYNEDEIFRLYNGLTHPPLSGLAELNSDYTSIFSDLTQTCLAGGIITEETARDFNPDSIMKHQFLTY